MSISGVSSVSSQQAITATNLTGAQPASPQQGAAQGAEATAASKDTVHVSASAQAKALKQSGQSPAQIALTMNTDVKTVDGYLGIQAAATTTTPAASEAAKAAPAAKVDTKA